MVQKLEQDQLLSPMWPRVIPLRAIRPGACEAALQVVLIEEQRGMAAQEPAGGIVFWDDCLVCRIIGGHLQIEPRRHNSPFCEAKVPNL